MRVLLFGAGVVGTIYGHALQEAGHVVTHYVRAGRRNRFSDGVQLCLVDARRGRPRHRVATYPPTFTEDLATPERSDLLLVSVRHYQLADVVPILATARTDAPILFFNGLWSDTAFIDSHLPRSRYLWGFPVAGGGFTGTRLDGALLKEVRLGELDGTLTPRLEAVAGLFRSAGVEPDVRGDIRDWLWTHFAINAGVIGAAFKAGSARWLVSSTLALHEAILAARDGLAVCRARGVDLSRQEDVRTFALPAWVAAAAMRILFATNQPVRAIMEYHTARDELRRIFTDVLTTGTELGVSITHLASLQIFLDAPAES
jgi:2-dehydropantoate 2-reductase